VRQLIPSPVVIEAVNLMQAQPWHPPTIVWHLSVEGLVRYVAPTEIEALSIAIRVGREERRPIDLRTEHRPQAA
jgi:hypothetical protein